MRNLALTWENNRDAEYTIVFGLKVKRGHLHVRKINTAESTWKKCLEGQLEESFIIITKGNIMKAWIPQTQKNEKIRLDLRTCKKYWLWMNCLHGQWSDPGLSPPPASPQHPRQTSSPVLIPLEFDQSKNPPWLRTFSGHSNPQPRVKPPPKQQVSGDKVCVYLLQLWCPASTQKILKSDKQKENRGSKMLVGLPAWKLGEMETWKESFVGSGCHGLGHCRGESISFGGRSPKLCQLPE